VKIRDKLWFSVGCLFLFVILADLILGVPSFKQDPVYWPVVLWVLVMGMIQGIAGKPESGSSTHKLLQTLGYCFIASAIAAETVALFQSPGSKSDMFRLAMFFLGLLVLTGWGISRKTKQIPMPRG